jgi:acetyl-CoA carboxylase biotin carboxyl carrier protein
MSDVRADMVANVMEIYVTEGATLNVGDTIVLLESMKMEIPVIAEESGTISRVAVSVGDVVQEGDLSVWTTAVVCLVLLTITLFAAALAHGVLLAI